MGSVDPDPDWESGSRQAKTVPKKEKWKKFHVVELSVGLQASPGSSMSFAGF
jgi:hypothetical protein